jgi:hypothetical protein
LGNSLSKVINGGKFGACFSRVLVGLCKASFNNVYGFDTRDWLSQSSKRVSASLASSAILLMNSKNCVAWTIEYGIDDLLISFGEAFGSHNRQRDMMAHACNRFRLKEIVGRCFEEPQHCRVLERGGVRHVDDHSGTGDGFGQTLAREGVDA